MGHTKYFLSLLTAIAALSFVLSTSTISAHAAASHDIEMTQSISPNASDITPGTQVNLTYTLTNVGTSNIAPNTLHYFFLPPELTYTGVSSSHAGFHCPQTIPATHPDVNVHSRYDNHSITVCYGTDVDQNFSSLAPGQSTSFVIRTTAQSKFTNNSTFILGVNNPNPQETDSFTLENAFDNGGDLATIPSNNITKYTYKSPASTPAPTDNKNNNNKTTPTTAATSVKPNSATSNSTASNSQTDSSKSANSSSTSNEATNGTPGILNSGDSQADSADRVEIASDISERLPERVATKDDTMVAAIFTGEYRYFFYTALISAFGILILALIMRRRYLNKVNSEKEYRRTLKIKQVSIESKTPSKV